MFCTISKQHVTSDRCKTCLESEADGTCQHLTDDQSFFEQEANSVRWIAAIDTDSFNYIPKQVTKREIDAHNMSHGPNEHITVWLTEESAQKECDLLNSM